MSSLADVCLKPSLGAQAYALARQYVGMLLTLLPIEKVRHRIALQNTYPQATDILAALPAACDLKPLPFPFALAPAQQPARVPVGV